MKKIRIKEKVGFVLGIIGLSFGFVFIPVELCARFGWISGEPSLPLLILAIINVFFGILNLRDSLDIKDSPKTSKSSPFSKPRNPWRINPPKVKKQEKKDKKIPKIWEKTSVGGRDVV